MSGVIDVRSNRCKELYMSGVIKMSSVLDVRSYRRQEL